ncbi:MAG: CoA pyrophosphatase [Rhodospirillales bacterium]|nr:CoA pyrophosphatase [Rhodospirillales bacterium]
MDQNYIRNKIAAHKPNTEVVRGDHNLNPGMDPNGPLTPAAVLVPLILRADGITILFTQRPLTMARHPGQISFPGGHVDDVDISAEATALRETEEEVGLSARHIEPIGRLDTYVIRTGYSVTPVVGIVHPPFEIKPDAHEVDEVFEVPFSFLMDPTNHERHSRNFEGLKREFYALPYEGRYIWGATAGMIVNLHTILTSPSGGSE